jgi:hypothetical protein
MANQYQSVCKEVNDLIRKSDFERAASLLKKYEMVRDTFITRAFYLLYSEKRSHYYSEAKARESLDFLEKSKDLWGIIEKGRCLLEGFLYTKDTFTAEDLFNSACRVSKNKGAEKARFYLGLIYANGLHTPNDNGSVDTQQAKKMFSEIMVGESVYKERAREEYCKVLMTSESISVSEEAELYSHLSVLLKNDPRRTASLYSAFILSSLTKLGDIVFDESRAPSGMTERAEFDSDYNQLRNAVSSLHKVLPHI